MFDVDGTTGNGNDYNILVGEPTYYGENWWLTNGSSAEAKAADPSGGNDGGNGSSVVRHAGRVEGRAARTHASWPAASASARASRAAA